ncbi:hypothetical protein HOY82DRAFT_616835 [Tuber indicum]|nr:hypothetical protein HOY82DRAFT_616835 [Tuber indicum]
MPKTDRTSEAAKGKVGNGWTPPLLLPLLLAACCCVVGDDDDDDGWMRPVPVRSGQSGSVLVPRPWSKP